MRVHHILLYLCVSLNDTTDLGAGYECFNAATPTMMACASGQVIAGWAVGGQVRPIDACKHGMTVDDSTGTTMTIWI